MRVVLDTNVVLVSFSSRSPYHWLFRALVEGAYTLCLTTEIALEYQEVVGRHMGRGFAEDLGAFLESSRSVEWVHRYYRWRLIEADPEDNKFVDCAVAAGAACLVTEDRHFDVLTSVDFPVVPVVGVDGFRALLDEG